MSCPFLPDDLVPQILILLPTKTLAKFHCVCSSWGAFISDPVFRKRHLDRCLQHPALLLCSTSTVSFSSRATIEYCDDNVEDDASDDEDGGSEYQGHNYNDVTLTISYLDAQRTQLKSFTKEGLGTGTYVVSICRDWVLLMDQCGRRIYLCNHNTEEFITSPKINREYYAIGFGYVPLTKEYKAVVTHKANSSCKVFTLGEATDHHRKWRDVASPNNNLWNSYITDTFVNGAIYIHSPRNPEVVASFNLEKEEWGELRTPPMGSTSGYYHLQAFSGYLCILDWAYSDQGLNIWLLKDYDKSSWVKEYSITPLKFDRYMFRNYVPLAIEDDGKILVQFNHSGLHLYDLQTKSFPEIHRLEEAHCSGDELEDKNMTFYVQRFLPLE